MDDNTFKKLAADAQIDQAMAGLGNLAKTFGAFYSSLLENGIPPMLADGMLRDWFRLQIYKMLWPDDPPSLGGL